MAETTLGPTFGRLRVLIIRRSSIVETECRKSPRQTSGKLSFSDAQMRRTGG